MPEPAIQLLLHEPRTELLKAGWASSRVAASLRAARITRIPLNGGCTSRYTEADMPQGVWQDPDTGYLMMRPSSLRYDFTESSAFLSARIPLSSLTVPPPVSAVPVFDEPADPSTGKPKMIALQRVDDTTPIASISGVPARYQGVHSTSNSDSMVFVAQTGNFDINEGLTITVQPSGLPTDRAAAWFGFMFGDRYYVQLGMNGSAALWEYGFQSCETSDPTQDWVRRQRFEYGQGGVDHSKPFQVTVFPWGMEFISILFSQAQQPSQPTKSTSQKVETNTFTFKVSQRDGNKPRFDVAHAHYVKIEPAPVRIAMRKLGYQYAFALAKLRFETSTSFVTLPESLDEPKGVDVTVNPIGFFPGGSTITATKFNEDGTAWNPATHVRFCPSITLNSSGSGKYTPELWGLEMEVLPQTHVASAPERVTDFSAQWSSLVWRESCHPDASELTVVMRRDTDWRNLLKLDGALTLTIDGDRRFEGYIERYRPHFDGLPVTPGFMVRKSLSETNEGDDSIPLRDNPVADDLWGRLNSCDCANFKSLTRRYIGDILLDGFKRAGFDASEIIISSPLNTLEIGGFEKADDWKQPSEDATVGDLFRRIIKTYAAQNADDLRIIRRGTRWHCYLAERFKVGTTQPTAVFMLDTSVHFPSGETDLLRWENPDGLGYLKILTQPEIYINRPSYNSLRVVSTSESNKNSIGLAAYIAPHPDSITDTDAVDYWGRVVPRTMGPSEAGHLTTQNEVERYARRVYDEEMRDSRQWTHAGEWQPFVRPDQFVWITGRDPNGDPISYGAWRIEEAMITIDVDEDPSQDSSPDGPVTSRRFLWSADYTLSWAGIYEKDETLMFSGTVPQ